MAISTSQFPVRQFALLRHSRGWPVTMLWLLGLLAVSQQGHSQGFGTTPTAWGLPPGGYTSTTHDYSYQSLSHIATSTSALDHTWATLDMNGDAKPDLVVLTEGNGSYNEPFGTGTGRYWKVYLNTGGGFGTTATTWTLPAGGRIATSSGRLASFDALEYAGTAYTGNQGWAVKDINGDSRPDLVVLTEGTGTYNETFGTGASRYWKVYLNTGTGFATTAVPWALPAGGYTDGTGHAHGFISLVFDQTLLIGGGQTWLVTDMNADSKPDLVVLTDGYQVFGPNTNSGGRYWKVYLNANTGYAVTPTTWSLPAGGFVFETGGIGSTTYYASFNGSTHREGSSNRKTGDQEWKMLDMNGDNRPDLAVVTEFDGTYLEPFGTGTARYWKVYLNTGTGFSTTATNWTLPEGGGINATTGRHYSFDWVAGEGSLLIGNQTWALQDLNGDARPDLVIVREGTGMYDDVFGAGTSRYWKAYLSTGTGFATTSTSWGLPTGGLLGGNNSHAYSFSQLAFAGYSNPVLGSQTWATLDINGDAKLDLVVLTEKNSAYDEPFGTGTGRYWKAYLNSAASLATRSAIGASSLELFPNPAPRAFTLRLPTMGAEHTAQLILLNALGQAVQTHDIGLRPGGTDAQVDVSALAPGLYTVRVRAGGQTAARQVVVE